jgi:hypothetical protein
MTCGGEGRIVPLERDLSGISAGFSDVFCFLRLPRRGRPVAPYVILSGTERTGWHPHDESPQGRMALVS